MNQGQSTRRHQNVHPSAAPCAEGRAPLRFRCNRLASDHNPFSEAQFKTLKYRPVFPERFGCIEDGRTYCRPFFDCYNRQHRHSGRHVYAARRARRTRRGPPLRSSQGPRRSLREASRAFSLTAYRLRRLFPSRPGLTSRLRQRRPRSRPISGPPRPAGPRSQHLPGSPRRRCRGRPHDRRRRSPNPDHGRLVFVDRFRTT